MKRPSPLRADKTPRWLLVDKRAMPDFKHEQCPQLSGVVTRPAAMLLQQTCHGPLIKIIALASARVGEQVVQHLSEFPVDPVFDRHVESLLRTMDDFMRDQPIDRAFQDMLRFPTVIGASQL